MTFIDDFFVFPEAIDIDGQLKCNVEPASYTLFFQDAAHKIELSALPADSVTLVLFDGPSRSFLQINHWEKIVSSSRLASQEALRVLRRACFLQIDSFNSKYFTKLFLPVKQMVLNSDTHDFSLYSHFPLSYLHPIDWQYQIGADVVSAEVKDNILEMILDIIPPVQTNRDMYLNYGDAAVKLSSGQNFVTAPYVQGELIYLSCIPHHKGMGNYCKIEGYL